MTSPADAQRLLQQGRVTEAAHAFALILEQEPGNVPALNFTALSALGAGNLPASLASIDKALSVEPQNPLTLHNRGRILQAAQRFAEAADSHRAALSVAPNLHVARLQLGRALELGGSSPQAIVVYARALQEAQQDGRWLNPASTPPDLRPLVEHAMQSVRRGRRAAIDALLAPVEAQYGRDSLKRVRLGIDIYFNEASVAPPDPRQRPTFFSLPGLPASPFIDTKYFPSMDQLAAMTGEIRRELYQLLKQDQGSERVFSTEELEAVHLRGMNQPPTWNGYYFYRYGEPRQDTRARCPITAAALDALPLCRIREHGPEVLFSVFTAGTHLLPHRGVTNVRLVSHLPLIVPGDCALVVGGEEHRWREGHVVVFDDTYEHEAWNRSNQVRIVLIADVWSPFVTDAERAALAPLFGEIGDFRRQVEATS